MVTRIVPKKRLGLSIAQWRKRRNQMSQEKLAEEIGTTKGSLSRWEKGERDITLNALTAIAEVLGCRVADLIDDPDHPGSILAKMDEGTRKRAIRLIEAIKDGD
jgi:transcriptional regulator with XRE-family HTH domain